MAYAALLSAAQAIKQILTHDQDWSSLCPKEQMNSLCQNIIWLQNFLEVIPMKYTSMTDQLESRLTDVAYQVEDIIEANMIGLPCDRLLTSAFCGCIEEVSSILQEAKELMKLFEETKGMPGRDFQSTSLLINAPGNKDAKVGLNEDLQLIFGRLTSYERSLLIIPIVGMGGIGKTTLARDVYEDPLMRRHFDVCSWITVSQEYNPQEILLQFLGEKPSIGQAGQNVESLIVRVYQSLYNRRFLIILDDIWHGEAWERIMPAIPNNYNGSRVILTTRSSHVAAEVNCSSPLHKMHLLHEDQSWDLLRVKVYGQEDCPPELEGVGRRVAENCKGLPLAIVVVAGLLKSKRTVDYWDYWEEVARNINEATASNGEFDRILSLSYNNLPPHLKSCFLYMGAFPEDFSIKTTKLILFWIAEGFVKPQASKTLEEIAEEYLEDLVGRNLLLVTANRYNGRIRTCSIHDVLRELSIKKAKAEKFLECFVGRDGDTNTSQNMIMSPYRLSISTQEFLSLPDGDNCNTHIRSLLFKDFRTNRQQQLIKSRRGVLKVLDGVAVTTNSMLKPLLELHNLRYLHFSFFHGDYPLEVPESISKLQKLETLVITRQEFTSRKVKFPANIWKIPTLRHIILDYGCNLCVPVEEGQGYPILETLQTLSLAINFKFTKSRIASMPNLKKLKIACSQGPPFNYVEMYCLENLVHLHQLEKLNLWFDIRVPSSVFPTHFVFPQNLKKLSLLRTHILWQHMSSIVGSLQHLEVLKLGHMSVEGSRWVPNDGEFERLKYLKMDPGNLEEWLVESTHFPSLEKLFIVRAYYMEIPLSVGSIDTLERLIVGGCSQKVNNSALEIQEEQMSFGNDALEIVICQ